MKNFMGFKSNTFNFLILITIIFSTPSHSQILEEVVVTARKREESLMEVPISITAFSGEKLAVYNMTDMDDMSSLIPGVTISDGILGGANINIRGIETIGNNAGFEQSVGVFVDGMYVGRSSFTRQGQIDLAQVEILKGPQSLYFGKNTIAGALNITSRNPTDEFEAYVQAGYEFESADELSLEAVVSGPLSDKVKGRLVARWVDSDGWIDNPVARGRSGEATEDLYLRGTLVFDISDHVTDTLKVNYMDSDMRGENPTDCVGAPSTLIFERQGSIEDCVEDQKVYHVLASQELADYLGDDLSHGGQTVTPGESGFSIFEGVTLVNRLDWDINDTLSMTNVTSYLDTDWDRAGDINQFEVAGPFYMREELTDFWSTDFRCKGDVSNDITWAGGIYYQEEDIDYSEFTRLVLFTDGNRNGIPFEPGDVLGQSWSGPKKQNSSELSVYAEISWDISERFNLNIGGRYTDIEKDIDHTLCASGFGFFGPAGIFTSSEPICDGGATDFLPIASDQHYQTSLSESVFTPSVQLTFTPTDNTMYYVSYVEGFKSGGFNFDQRNNFLADLNMDGIPDNDTNGDGVPDVGYKFDSEEAKAYEIGTKLTFGGFSVTAAVFFTEYSDLQLSVYDDKQLTFFTKNAGESEIKGLEGEITYFVSDTGLLGVSFQILDAEFTDYSAGQCTNDAIPDDPVAGTCDFTGNPLPQAADIQATLFGTRDTQVSDDLILNLRGDIAYTGSIDPWDEHVYGKRDSWININASASLSGRDGKWRISLVGRNLLDEQEYNGWRDHQWNNFLAGPSAALGAPGNFYIANALQGREISIIGRYNF